MLFKECFKIHIIEYRANQGNVFPKKSSYCKDHAIQGLVNQGPTVFGVCKKCHFLELFLCSQDIYLWCYCDVVTGQFCLNFFSLRIILALSPDCC